MLSTEDSNDKCYLLKIAMSNAIYWRQQYQMLSTEDNNINAIYWR